jgi:hypothetical protein
MTGILLIGVLLIWLVIALFIAYAILGFLPKRWWSGLVATGLFFALLPLPLIDEILAKPRFEELCRNVATVQVHTLSTQERKVNLKDRELKKFDSYGLQIQQERMNYSDITTGELVFSHTGVLVRGGFLIRTLGISETNSPVLFDKYCGPKNSQTFLKDLGVTIVDTPVQTKGEKNDHH